MKSEGKDRSMGNRTVIKDRKIFDKGATIISDYKKNC